MSYIERAFDFRRVFIYKWSVNWQFLPESLFLDTRFGGSLLVLHISVLVLFLARAERALTTTPEQPSTSVLNPSTHILSLIDFPFHVCVSL
jgi:hypothetical protein